MLSLALVLTLRAIAPGPPGLELRWEAPPECPDRARLLAAIDATLGEVAEGERRSLRVRGRVRAEPSAGFVVRLELDDGRASTRELRGTSCEELTDAAALVIAMTIDPRLLETLQGPLEVPTPPASPEPGETETDAAAGGGSTAAGEAEAGGEAPEGTPDERGATEAPAEPRATDETTADGTAAEPGPAERPSDRTPSDPRADASPREPLRRIPATLRFLGRVQAGIGGGPLPGATAVLGLAAGLGGRGWRAELSASYGTPRTRTSTANPAVGVRAQLWTVGVHGCGEPRWRTVSFPLCAGLLAGAVHARGVGDLIPSTVASPWVAAALEPGVVWWALPRLGLALRAEGHAALRRPAFRSEPSGTVFMGSVIGGAVRAGVELRMP